MCYCYIAVVIRFQGTTCSKFFSVFNKKHLIQSYCCHTWYFMNKKVLLWIIIFAHHSYTSSEKKLTQQGLSKPVCLTDFELIATCYLLEQTCISVWSSPDSRTVVTKVVQEILKLTTVWWGRFPGYQWKMKIGFYLGRMPFLLKWKYITEREIDSINILIAVHWENTELNIIDGPYFCNKQF